MSAVELADIERPLALFAQGITGRPYQIEPEDAFEGRWERAEGAALHNPTALYLPRSFDLYADLAENLGGLRLTALHQLCYQEFGSHDFRLVEAYRRCPELGARGDPKTPPRESDLTALFALFSIPVLARTLFRIIEAARIDHHMRRHYPGVEAYYLRFREYELERRPSGPITGLTQLLEAMIVNGLGVGPTWFDRRDRTGTLEPLRQGMAAVHNAGADVYTTTGAMVACYEILENSTVIQGISGITGADQSDPNAADDPDIAPLAPAIHGDPPLEWLQRDSRLRQWQEELADLQSSLDTAGGSNDADLFDLEAPDGLHQGLSAPLLDAIDGPASAGEAAGGETRPEGLSSAASDTADTADLEAERDTLQRRVDMEQASLRNAFGAPPHASQSFLYDEWDANQQSYRRAWCRLFEIPLEPASGNEEAPLLAAIAPHRDAVRRRFEQLRPEAFSRIRKVPDGDELDWDQVIAYRVDRHRTATPDDRVYQRRNRVQRDVTAAFLVDLSASTDDPIEPPDSEAQSDSESGSAAGPGPAPNVRDPFEDDSLLWSLDATGEDAEPSRRIIDIQREALLLMADALDRLGDRFGVFGFSGYGRECVEFYLAKDFNAPWNHRAVKSLAAMKPRRSTRMGPAIRHASRRLSRAGGALKVMIVVSDGFPQDCDYGPDRGSHDYGVADTAMALREAERSGITTFCITVDRSGHDYLKAMCDERRYMIIDEIETLPEALTKVYAALTT